MLRVLSPLAGLALTAALLGAPPGGSHAVAAASPGGSVSSVREVYVVALADPPAASYSGGVHGYAATVPSAGSRFDAHDPAVVSYRSHLLAEQDSILKTIGSPQPLYSYTAALNGFAVALTDAQAKELQSSPAVASIERDSTAKLDGVPEAQAVPLSGAAPTRKAGGQEAAPAGSPNTAGRGMVIGVVDSGLWPENPSFAGIPIDASTVQSRYPGFVGFCSAGEQWRANTCTAKVLAARYFVAGFGAAHVAAADYLSPRDGSGHGSHVAATAAGNDGVHVQIEQQDFDHLSGVAPAAALAIYKACWSAPDPSDDGCSTADSVAAVDAAVSDGVNVLTYAASTAGASPSGALERAFLGASAAGVFVATSAGNTGLTGAPVSHPSPWVTTVAASSHDPYLGSVRLGNGDRYVGAMVSDTNAGRAPLVYAGDVPARGVSPHRAALCYPGSLDATAVDATIVVCDRGVTARVSKSATVAQAGGTAVILVNRGPGSTDADFHAVPTVHLGARDGRAVRQYAATAQRPTASLRAHSRADRPAPTVASFSARGPAASNGDLLKPDVTAPGVSVIAAVAPPANFGHLWDLYSGTSMATAAVAGLAAVLLSDHPQWSPAAVKSAMMTTATRLPAAGPWKQGAGDINPPAATDPGLVYDTDQTSLTRYLDALRGQFPLVPSVGDRGSQLNTPAIAIGRMVANAQVTRTVTNVSTTAETYSAVLNRPHGVAMAVDPATFTVQPGESQAFTVAFSARQPARYDHFAVGSLTWRGSAGHVVTSPIVVRPELVDPPAETTASGRHGTASILVGSGVTGLIRPSIVGPVGAAPTRLVLEPGPFEPAEPRRSSSTATQSFDVPVSTAVLRVDLQAASRGDDLDLYVYRDGSLVAADDSPAADGRVTLVDPPPGRYDIYVNAASSATGDTTTAQLTRWVVPPGASRVADVSSPSVPTTGGRPFVVGVHWSKLPRGQRYFGYVAYRGSDRRTYLTVN